VSALEVNAEIQQQKVNGIADEIRKYTVDQSVERNNPFSGKRDTITSTQNTLAARLIDAKFALSQAEIRNSQVEAAKAMGKDLKDLPFIADRVSSQVKDISTMEIQRQLFAKRYFGKISGYDPGEPAV